MKQRWSRLLLATLGLRVQISGKLPTGQLLLVANHVSWLDIYLINSLCPVAFVSKADVQSWPLIGWLAKHNDTIFLQRGSRGHAHLINREIAHVISEGCPVTVFPEGTTTEGNQILHFHGALLQPALSVGARLVPLSVRYCESSSPSQPSKKAAYAGETSLGQSLWCIAGCKDLHAHLSVLDPLMGSDRKILAAEARGAIAVNLGIKLT
jgi:1-acyl-sn-glycerol-3-phosphate acyltransferase